MKAYKFRIYPSGKQQGILLLYLGRCREVYNELLAEGKDLIVSGRSDFYGLVRDVKIAMPKRYGCVYSLVLQNVADRLSKAYANFFRRVGERSKGSCVRAGFPRFNTKLRSLTYPQSGVRIIDTSRRHQVLRLSKIGDIKVRCHRSLEGSVKTLTVKQSPSGKWFATFTAHTGSSPDKVAIKNASQVVGLDLGVKDLVFDSEGASVVNPKHLARHEHRLRALQKNLSRKRMRSRNFCKAKLRVARQHEHTANTRADFLHKLSRKYIKAYDAIGIEDLDISNMLTSSFSRNILDCGWGTLRQMLFCKAESAGKTIVPVNPSMTTQLCSNCGQLVRKTLSERTHNCLYCGLMLPRDHNSAITVKKRALETLGMDDPESTPAETKPLPTPYYWAGKYRQGSRNPAQKKALPPLPNPGTGSPACKGQKPKQVAQQGNPFMTGRTSLFKINHKHKTLTICY